MSWWVLVGTWREKISKEKLDLLPSVAKIILVPVSVMLCPSPSGDATGKLVLMKKKKIIK